MCIRDRLGPERAENIAPTGWAMQRGMMFTTHHDAPVANPDSIRVLAATVNRTTRTGYVLGPQQRVEPIVALKAMTLWSAYQNFEENTKGSIETGKFADFVVLSDNCLLYTSDAADASRFRRVWQSRKLFQPCARPVQRRRRPESRP